MEAASCNPVSLPFNASATASRPPFVSALTSMSNANSASPRRTDENCSSAAMRSVRLMLPAMACCSVSICSSLKLALTSAVRSAFGSALTAVMNRGDDVAVANGRGHADGGGGVDLESAARAPVAREPHRLGRHARGANLERAARAERGAHRHRGARRELGRADDRQTRRRQGIDDARRSTAPVNCTLPSPSNEAYAPAWSSANRRRRAESPRAPRCRSAPRQGWGSRREVERMEVPRGQGRAAGHAERGGS